MIRPLSLESLAHVAGAKPKPDPDPLPWRVVDLNPLPRLDPDPLPWKSGRR